MKIQTSALVERFLVDGTSSYDLGSQQKLQLEFSAIDAGGGFRDPILDFTYSLSVTENIDVDDKMHEIKLYLKDPKQKDSKVTLAYNGILKVVEGNCITGNGRLKEEKITKEVITFVIKSVR